MKNFWFLLLPLSLIIAGCSTSQITSEWKAPNTMAKPFQKIMVVGMIREADRSLRKDMEAHLEGDLKDMGYNAFSAYKEYGPKALEDMTEQQVYEKLHKDGVDAVVTIVLLDKEKERYYYPGNIYYSPYVVYSGRFYGYYRTMWWRIESPGYYNISTRYFWESNLYDLTGEKLLFSVQTQSFDPASSASLAHEYGKMIVQHMAKAGVLTKQPAAPVPAL